MYERIILTFANHKCIECDHWMPKREEERPTARQERLHHSPGGSVYTRTLTASSPSTLCSGFQLTVPCLHPILEGKAGPFPGGPEGGRGKAPRKALSLSHPAPAKSQACPESPGGQGWVWRASTGLWGRHSQCWATPVPKSRGGAWSRVMTPAAKWLPPSSRRHLKGGRIRKGSERRPRCHGGFIFPPP